MELTSPCKLSTFTVRYWLRLWMYPFKDEAQTALFNPLNAELNPICYLLALLGAHHFLHVSRIRVKDPVRTAL